MDDAIRELPRGSTLREEHLPVHHYRAVEIQGARLVNLSVKESGPMQWGRLSNSVYMREIEARVCARKGDVIALPATWWAQLVATHFPKWWRKRWPPAMIEYHARAYVPGLELGRGLDYGRVVWFDEFSLRDVEP